MTSNLRSRWQRCSQLCARRWRSEEGNAIVEFIFASTVLLIPMVYLILAAAALEAGSYAVVSAADQAAKVFASSSTPGVAEQRARQVADRALQNYGFESAQTSIACDLACLAPGSVVTVTVTLRVPLPVVSEFINTSAFTVDATSAQRVDRFG